MTVLYCKACFDVDDVITKLEQNEQCSIHSIKVSMKELLKRVPRCLICNKIQSCHCCTICGSFDDRFHVKKYLCYYNEKARTSIFRWIWT